MTAHTGAQQRFAGRILLALVVGLGLLAHGFTVHAGQACATALGACLMGGPGAPGAVCYCPAVLGPVWGRIVAIPQEPFPEPVETWDRDEREPAPHAARRSERLDLGTMRRPPLEPRARPAPWTPAASSTHTEGSASERSELATRPAVSATTPSPAAADGAALQAALVKLGVLDDYLIAITRDVTANLVRVSKRWERSQVNGPYDARGINLYQIDSRKLPAGHSLADHGLHNPEGNATTLEAARVIVIDTAFLKSMVTTAMLMSDESMDTMKAVATLRVRDLDSFADRWNPAGNRAMREAGPTEKWRLLYTGALGFIVAHELGHVALGPQERAPRTQPVSFTGRDRDTYRACPLLVDPAHRERQLLEAKADRIATEMLAGLCGRLTPQQPRRFLYELGAEWYFVYNMNVNLVSTLSVTDSRVIHAYMKATLGAPLYEAVRKAAPTENVGSVRLFFPFEHPPDYRRAAESIGQLRRSPCSYFHNEPHPAEQQMLEQVRERACTEVAGRSRR